MDAHMIVTRLAWIAARFVFSINETACDSTACWKASSASDLMRFGSPLNPGVFSNPCMISLTMRANGALRMQRSVLF